MSLDDRLRRGLQTLDEPASDPARELEKFRSSAYPRRARRRVLLTVAGAFAAAALIAGVTTAALNSTKKASNFIHPIPDNVPACRSGDTQGLMTTGPVVVKNGKDTVFYVSFSVYANGKSCRIDETIAPTITADSIQYPALNGGAPAPALMIQGNGSSGLLAGIVPMMSANRSLVTSSALSISWAWTNWCGTDRSFSVSFKRLSGTTNTLDTLEGSRATLPFVPACADPAAPSVLRGTPATLGPEPHAQGYQFDLNPPVIAPQAGLESLMAVYVDHVIVSPDGMTLLVSFVHGDQCSLFARIDVKEGAHTVRITPYVGDLPGGPTCPLAGHVGDAARIVLKDPLGNRRIVDGTDPSLTVQVAHQTRR